MVRTKVRNIAENGVLAVILLWTCVGWTADEVHPLNVKLGLWEVTSSNTMTGMPPIPAEALARMTPEQRAQFEQRMKNSMGGPQPRTRKECVTAEKLKKDYAFGEDRKNCTHTILSTSPTKTEIKMQCQQEKSTMEGVFRIEALSSDHVKGTMQMSTSGNGQNMNMHFEFNGQYLGSDCGDTKP